MAPFLPNFLARGLACLFLRNSQTYDDPDMGRSFRQPLVTVHFFGGGLFGQGGASRSEAFEGRRNRSLGNNRVYHRIYDGLFFDEYSRAPALSMGFLHTYSSPYRLYYFCMC